MNYACQTNLEAAYRLLCILAGNMKRSRLPGVVLRPIREGDDVFFFSQDPIDDFSYLAITICRLPAPKRIWPRGKARSDPSEVKG